MTGIRLLSPAGRGLQSVCAQECRLAGQLVHAQGPYWTPASGQSAHQHLYTVIAITPMPALAFTVSLYFCSSPYSRLVSFLLHLITRDLGNTHPQGVWALWALTLSKMNQQVASPEAQVSLFFYYIKLCKRFSLPRLRPAASQSWSHTSHLPVTYLGSQALRHKGSL